MKRFTIIATLASALMLASTSCKKEDNNDNNNNQNTSGEFVMKLENVWGHNEDQFSLGTDLVHPMTGDTLNFSMFKYYISNIKLQDANGNWWVDEDSYYLVDQSEMASMNITFEDVPKGDYVEMEITLGVDSARNVSGAQTGALDVANGMFWSWNSGYIMIKTEGTSPQAPDGDFAYHLGGFYGPDKAVHVVNITLPTVMSVSAAATPQMHVYTNPAKLWHSAGSVSNGAKIHMPGPKAGMMATDFQTAVYVHHIHN